MYQSREYLQKGDVGPWIGNLNFSMQGGLEVDIYSCPKCGKIEFFWPGILDDQRFEEVLEDLPPDVTQNLVGVSRDGIPQVQCPCCRTKHDFDYPECPKCGYQA